MKQLLISILSCCALIHTSKAQEYIPWESNILSDSISWSDDFSVDEHRSIHPRIINRRSNTSFAKTNKQQAPIFKVIPVSDLVYGNTKSMHQFRSGVGFAANYIHQSGFSMKFAYLGGISNTNAINYTGGVYPFALIRRPIKSSQLWQTHDVRFRLSYSPNKFFNFQTGIDHNMLGEGNRSLLLGDYGSPYPFAQMRIKVWRMEYVALHSYLQNPTANMQSTRPKFSAIHYLSMNLHKRFNLSFFEAIVYDGMVGNQRRGIEWEYLNPFVIYRPLEFAIGSTDGVLLGTNLSYRINKNCTLYGQIVLDEFKIALITARNRNIANKFGYQLGFKGKKELQGGNLLYFTEFNLLRPYTFAHSNPGQAYSNMLNPLAHPMGANFIENTSRIQYKVGRFDFSLDFVNSVRGSDFGDSVSWGSDVNVSIFQSPVDENNVRIIDGFYIGGGNKTNISKLQAGAGYVIHPQFKTRVFVMLEAFWLTQNQSTTYYQGIYFGLRTELWNDHRNY